MKIVATLALLAALACPGPTEAKGCIKGAVVGGAAGHVLGHHAVAGAAVGCAVGVHEAHKEAKSQKLQSTPTQGSRDSAPNNSTGSAATPGLTEEAPRDATEEKPAQRS